MKARIFTFFVVLLLLGQFSRGQSSPNITITTPTVLPTLTACSGQGTFTVHVANISGTAINNLVFRDSMPSGINYVAGSVSGAGVTFGSTVTANNIVTFNIATIPSSGSVDVIFAAAANCSVSTTAANIYNTYRVNWGSFFTSAFTTANYGISFPSLSISSTNASINPTCLSTFVRQITISNGGTGSVDSITLTDVESATSLAIQNFNYGTVTGQGTNSAKTVLHAADFAMVGNHDGKLDQNESIVVSDTLKVVGSTTPIQGTLTANWGCSGNSCTPGTPNNVYIVNTTIDQTSSAPSLTRYTYFIGPADSAGQIYGRPANYREVVKNTSSVTAGSVFIDPTVSGLNYLDTATFMISINGGTPYHPINMTHYGTANNNVNTSMGNVLLPSPYFGSGFPNEAAVPLGDLAPGDSAVVIWQVKTAGPVTRVSDAYGNSGSGQCGVYYGQVDGPTISACTDARIDWKGCPAGSYNLCAQAFPATIYNGYSSTPVALPTSNAPIYLARFRGYTYADSTIGNRCAYYGNDTVKVLMATGVMDLPFYTTKSKFFVKIKTNGGVKWDGNLSAVIGRLTSWTSNPWYADHVVDSTTYDSTIRVYFKQGNLPAASVTNLNSDIYHSYRGGGFSLAIHFVNTCPGPAQKRVMMTRVYTIDTTSTDPAIEAGGNVFPASYTWNSNCPGACSDGVQILSYGHARTTFGQPDNNLDGDPDGTGTIDLTKVNTNLITWGDTLQLKYKLVVKTTQAGGISYMYMNSTINYSDANIATIVNNYLKKDSVRVTLTRGAAKYTSVGSSVPANTTNAYLLNLSLAGTGGINIPSITTYQNGDTLDVVENLIYFTPHVGFGLSTYSFSHVPYTSIVANPTAAQQMKCDSVTCNFQTVDMGMGSATSNLQNNSCADTTITRFEIYSTLNGGCGANNFPYEARNVFYPTYMKMVLPAAGQWSIKSLKLSWTKKFYGTGGCNGSYPIAAVLPTNLYNIIGDTVYFDLKQIGQYYGQDITVNNLLSHFYFDFTMKYTRLATDSGCTLDHSFPQTYFVFPTQFSTSRPIDSTTTRLINYTSQNSVSYGGNYGSTFLGAPGSNNNTVTLSAGNKATVTTPTVVVPVTYFKFYGGQPLGNDFMAIPNRPGIIVDSVLDAVTGSKVATVAGSAIYQVGYLGANVSRLFNIYTHVSLCNPDSLIIYADRTPCTGYPASWATYGCQNQAQSVKYSYLTFAGELQMVDSLYNTQKDICTTDTVQFRVVNSQTQDATGVKISFTLPTGMALAPGQTQVKKGNGTFVTVSDPVLNAGVYSYTIASNDTLRNVSTSPANILTLRAGVTTSCGFVSGSQINSSVAGNVACGNITSLFNTNPPALNINGAPSLSYFTNAKAVVTQVANCAASGQYNYRISMKTSGGSTGTNDSVKVILPSDYSFAAYNPAYTGAKNAPFAQPTQIRLANGNLQLSWLMPAAVIGGDSIVYTFQYAEANQSNKCAQSPLRYSTIGTYINSSVTCATTGTVCSVAIANGADTFAMQSLKPSLTTSVSSVTYNKTSGGPAFLTVVGTITNGGSADLTPGTNMIMEPFSDLDNSGTVTTGDYLFKPFVFGGGIAIGASVNYTYKDTVATGACTNCTGNILLRISNNPTTPVGATQCFCDTAIIKAVTASVVLDLKLNDFAASVVGCNQAKLYWSTLIESASGSSFEVQSSSDGYNFTKVATIKANGIVSGSSYSTTVDLAQGTTYYRILLLDNGVAIYSSIITARSNCFSNGQSIAAYPNPFKNAISVAGAPVGSVIKLMDITGKIILEQKASGTGNDQLPNTILSQGIYLLKIQDGSGVITTLKMKKD